MFIISYERPDAKATLIKQRSIPMSFFDEKFHEVVLREWEPLHFATQSCSRQRDCGEPKVETSKT